MTEDQNAGTAIPVTVTVDLDPQPKIAVTTDPLLCYDGDAVFDISTVNSPLHAGSQWRYDVSVVYPAGSYRQLGSRADRPDSKHSY